MDYSKALEKSSVHRLPAPELWVIRLLQGFSRLGAGEVRVVQSRRTVRIEAELATDLEAENSLRDLFRVSDPDPRLPVQDAVWGARAKGFQLEIEWPEAGKTGLLKVGSGQPSLAMEARPRHSTSLCVTIASYKDSSLLFKLFGRLDFSAEFRAIAQSGFMAPFRLYLDGRPYDFHNSLDLDKPKVEYRGGRTIDGPSFRLPPTISQVLHFPEQGPIPSEGKWWRGELELSYLLLARWCGETEARSTIHWIQDGFVVETEVLDKVSSHLQLEFYLPADGLATDFTRFQLMRTASLAERRASFYTQAYFSLCATPPLWTEDVQLVEREIQGIFKEHLPPTQLVKTFQKRQRKSKSHEHFERVLNRLHRLRDQLDDPRKQALEAGKAWVAPTESPEEATEGTFQDIYIHLSRKGGGAEKSGKPR